MAESDELSGCAAWYSMPILTVNKVNNGVESRPWEGPRDPGFQYSYCSLGNVSRWIIYTTSPSFLFYCFFVCIVYNVFFSCVMNTFPKFENWTAVLDFGKARQRISRNIFLKFQMAIASSKIWLETRFVYQYDEYDWYCQQIRGAGNTDARFDGAVYHGMYSSSAQ